MAKNKTNPITKSLIVAVFGVSSLSSPISNTNTYTMNTGIGTNYSTIQYDEFMKNETLSLNQKNIGGDICVKKDIFENQNNSKVIDAIIEIKNVYKHIPKYYFDEDYEEL